MSAYFTNSLTAPTGFGLLTSLRGGFSHRSGSAWPGRSQKDGLPSARGESIVSGSRPNSRTGGAAWSLPLLIGSGNGRQDARPRFARPPVAVLRILCLGGGSRRFWLDVFCPRCSRDARRGLWAAALTAAPKKQPRFPAGGGACGRIPRGDSRRSFHAKAIRIAATWFRLPEKKNPAARPLACGVSSSTPEFLRREAPAFKGGHQAAVPC